MCTPLLNLPRRGLTQLAVSLLLAVALAACGGGSDASGSAGSTGATDSASPNTPTSGASTPGSGHTACPPGAPDCGPVSTEPNTPAPTVSPAPLPSASAVAGICTPAGEKAFIRAHLNENYLWYPEITEVDAAQSPSVEDYFYSLLVPERDRFSFIVPTAVADSMSTGANVGYGLEWQRDAAGQQRIAWVTPGSPAAQAGLARGGLLVSVLKAAPNSWYPNVADASVTFTYRDAPTAAAREVTLTAAPVQDDPLPTVSVLARPGGGLLGYLLFNEHSSVAQDRLIDAMARLRSSGVSDGVLDLRYNSGGYLFVAQSVASMVAGTRAGGAVFERFQFNDKRAQDATLAPYPFTTQVLYSDGGRHRTGEPLPLLNLPRLYVLTTDATCSASESIINGLRGVDVDVIVIGSATCGKPYGFMRRDNCGKALYAIEFKGVNAKGDGDYARGFAPTCAAADDFDHALGDPAEGLLATALHHLQTNACPPIGTERAAVRAAPAGVPMFGRPPNPGRRLR